MTPIVAAAVRGAPDIRVVEVGPGSLQCARTHRPRWALVAGILTLPAFGLGILFLLVKRTDVCRITVADSPRGTTITLAGSLDPAAVEALRRVIDEGDPTASDVEQAPATSMREELAAPSMNDILESTVASATTVTPSPIPLPSALAPSEADDRTVVRTSRRSNTRLRFDHGATVELDGALVVGRDPSATAAGVPSAAVVAVADPGMSVSKTHLIITDDARGLVVDDLHSTNGTVVVPTGGSPVPVEPGRAVAVAPGCVIEFGDRRIEVLGP